MKKSIQIIILALIVIVLAACSNNTNSQEFPKTPYTSGNVSLTF